MHVIYEGRKRFGIDHVFAKVSAHFVAGVSHYDLILMCLVLSLRITHTASLTSLTVSQRNMLISSFHISWRVDPHTRFEELGRLALLLTISGTTELGLTEHLNRFCQRSS